MRELLFSIEKLELIGNGDAVVGGRCCRDVIEPGMTAALILPDVLASELKLMWFLNGTNP